MENTELKNIISTFIKQPSENITEATTIDKTVVQGSILIHRMYAEIAGLGFEVKDYTEVRTFGQLLGIIDGNNITENIPPQIIPTLNEISENRRSSIGVDVEKISNFKEVQDYREDNFYIQNFSSTEISYCMLQVNALQSFAGKFAAKEAIIKADNNFKKVPFNKIEIENNQDGKPFFPKFSISISHTDELAIAVAMQEKQENFNIIEKSNDNLQDNNSSPIIKYISVLALLLSLLSASFIIVQHFMS